jgi:hypothetical protein
MRVLTILTGLIFAVGLLMGYIAHADDEDMLETPNSEQREPNSTAAISASKRTYPGGADEEDLQVQPRLPEAPLKTDARSLQRTVYKALYNQELKDERTENVEE